MQYGRCIESGYFLKLIFLRQIASLLEPMFDLSIPQLEDFIVIDGKI